MRLFLILGFLVLAPVASVAQESDSLVIATIDGKSIMIAIDDIKAITFKTISLTSVDAKKDDASGKLIVHPNPASENATVTFPVQTPQLATLEIARTDGQVVQTIEQFCQSGTSSIIWNGLMTDGSPAQIGTYLFRVVLREQTLSGKLSLRK